jgi:glycolate oxidase
VTGEHGIGQLKRAGLERELSAPVVEMHHAVKNALDPYQIFNPRKAIPGRTSG